LFWREHPAVPSNLVILETPDVDSVAQVNWERAARIRPGGEPGADFGPITLPRQLEIIQRHLDDAFARGARALHGRRVDADDVDPRLGRLAEHRALGLVLRPLVVGQEPAPVRRILPPDGPARLPDRGC
jgi:hypothetical protein